VQFVSVTPYVESNRQRSWPFANSFINPVISGPSEP
jgi:hypothetical protein